MSGVSIQVRFALYIISDICVTNFSLPLSFSRVINVKIVKLILYTRILPIARRILMFTALNFSVAAPLSLYFGLLALYLFTSEGNVLTPLFASAESSILSVCIHIIYIYIYIYISLL